MNAVHVPTVFSVFPTFDAGGAQSRFVALANHFDCRLRHVICSMDGQYGCVSALNGSLSVRTAQLAHGKRTSLRKLAAMRTALKSARPDFLLTHNWGSIEWALARYGLNVRHIHIEDGFGANEASRQYPRRVLARRLALRESSVVVPSYTLARIAERDWHIAPQRLHRIPNGIDLNRFAPRGAFQLESEIPVIGTVCALRPEKNLHRLLRAFATVRPQKACHLTVVGDGPERLPLEATAKQLGIADFVAFLGHLADPATLYKGFDVFALSSDTEQMPYTVIEAMAAGCPIAATDVGDIARMVAPENRPFIVAQSDEAISDALLRLLVDGALRRAVGAANADYAQQHFGQNRMFQAFARLFELAS